MLLGAGLRSSLQQTPQEGHRRDHLYPGVHPEPYEGDAAGQQTRPDGDECLDDVPGYRVTTQAFPQ